MTTIQQQRGKKHLAMVKLTSLECVDPLEYQIQRFVGTKTDCYENYEVQRDIVVCMVRHS